MRALTPCCGSTSASGTFEVFEPYKIPRPNVYDVIPDSNNNGYFLVLGAEDVGRIDAKSGEIKIFKTPTTRSGPRRGMMDAQDRLWFGENNGDRIGMFDTRTERSRNGRADAWRVAVQRHRRQERQRLVGGEYHDRICASIRERRVRRVPAAAADERAARVRRQPTTPVTFWVGSNHGASIVRLEPLEAQPAYPVAAAAATGPTFSRRPPDRRRRPRANRELRDIVERGLLRRGSRGALRAGRRAPRRPLWQDGDARARRRPRPPGLSPGPDFRADNYTRDNILDDLDRFRISASRLCSKPEPDAALFPSVRKDAHSDALLHHRSRLRDAECRTRRADARRGVRRRDRR